VCSATISCYDNRGGSIKPQELLRLHTLHLVIAVFAQTPFSRQETASDDIVVLARSTKCLLRFADRELDKAEFKRRTAQWVAGRPVRVIARQSADLKCLAKIAFQLADRGVRRITFVEPSEATAPKLPAPWAQGDDPFEVDPHAAKRPPVGDGDRSTP